MRLIGRILLFLLPAVGVCLFAVIGLAHEKAWVEHVRRGAELELCSVTGRPVTVGAASLTITGKLVLTSVRMSMGKSAGARAGKPSRPEPSQAAADRIEIQGDLGRGMKRANLLSSIRSVRIIRPTLVVRRLPDGRWELEDLLRQFRRPARGLSISVEVVDAAVEAIDARPPSLSPKVVKVSLHPLDAVAAVEPNGSSRFRVSSPASGGPLRSMLAFGEKQGQRWHLTVLARGVDLPVVWPYFGLSKMARFESGRADALIHASSPPVSISGSLRLTEAQAVIRELRSPVQQAEGVIRFAGKGLEVDNLRCRLGRSPILLSGRIWDVKRPAGELEISSPGALPSDLPLQAEVQRALPGQAAFALHLRGPLRSPELKGWVRAQRFRVGKFECRQAACDLILSGSRLQIDNLRAKAYGGSLTGRAGFDLRRGYEGARFEGKLEGADPDLVVPALGSISGRLPRDLSGRLSAELSVWRQGGESRGTAEVRIDGGRLGRLRFASFESAFSWRGPEVNIERASLRSSAGLFEAAGRLAPDGKVEAVLAGREIDLARLGPALSDRQPSSSPGLARALKLARNEGKPGVSASAESEMPPLKGKASFWCVVSGSLKEPHFQGAVQIARGSLGRIPFDLLMAQVDAGAAGIELVSAGGSAAGGTFALSGNISGERWFRAFARSGASARRRSEGKLDVALELHRAELSQLFPDWRIGGKAAAKLNVSGDLQQPKFVGSVQIRRPEIAGRAFDFAQADVAADGRAVELRSGELSSGSSRLQVSGTIGSEGPIDLRFASDRFLLADFEIPALREAGLRAEGAFRIEGRATGTLESPAVTAAVHAADLTVNGQPIGDGSLVLETSGKKVSIRDAAVSRGRARWEVSGSVDGEHKTLDLAVNLSGAELRDLRSVVEAMESEKGKESRLLRTARRLSRLPRPLEGTLDARIALSGDWERPRISLKAQIKEASLAGHPFPDIVGEGEIQGSVITVSDFRAERGEARAVARGRVDLDGEVSLDVDAYNLAADLAEPWLDKPLPVEGSADISFTISGPTDSPRVTGSAEAAPLKVGEISLDGARLTRFEIAERRLLIEELILVKAPHRASIAGTLPFEWSPLRIPDDQPIHLSAQVKDQGLGILSVFFPREKGLAGHIDGLLEIEGTRKDPILRSGQLSISDGAVAASDLGAPIGGLRADIRLQDGVIKVNQLEGRAGQVGRFEVKAGSSVELRHLDRERFTRNRFDISLEAKQMPIRVAGLAAGDIDASLKLAGGGERPLSLSGGATAHDGFSVQMGREFRGRGPLAGLPLDAALDIDLRVLPALWATSASARIGLQGRGHITGTVKSPRLSAVLEGTSGWLQFPTARLRIVHSSADVSIAPGVSGQIEGRFIVRVQAEGQVKGYEVVLTMSGPADNMSVSATSVPPLPERDITALLTGGAPFAEALAAPEAGALLARTARDVLTASLGPQALRPLERVFTTGLGLEEFSFEFNYGEPVRVRTGTYLLRQILGRQLYLSYSRTLTGRLPSFTLRISYQLTPYLALSWSTREQETDRLELHQVKRF
jgi:autotransporter translocation and assembly factor TamB